MILKVVLTTRNSLILEMKCQKIVSHTHKFILFMVQLEGEQKVIVTNITSSQALSTEQEHVDKLVEGFKDIFTSTTRVPLHFQVKHPHTWDENLPYVQHSYSISLHRSISHNPFIVCLGFQPFVPIDVSMPIASSLVESSHSNIEANKVEKLVE